MILSPRAERDLADIGDYVAGDSKRAARQLVTGLQASCSRLGSLAKGYSLLDFGPPTLRRAYHGPFHIYFTIGVATVRIERILHGARDVRVRFGDD